MAETTDDGDDRQPYQYCLGSSSVVSVSFRVYGNPATPSAVVFFSLLLSPHLISAVNTSAGRAVGRRN